MMKKRVRRFDDGGMASSGIQSAFDQPRSTSGGIGLGNNAPLVQIGSETGVGGVRAAPQAYGPLNIGQPVQQQQMKKGGKVKTKAYASGGDIDAPSTKYDNQRYTGMAQFEGDDSGKTYDTYRDKNRVERYDDPKNKRTLVPFSDTKKIQPPAVLARDRAEENRPKRIKKYAKGGAVKSRGDGCAQRGKTRGTMR